MNNPEERIAQIEAIADLLIEHEHERFGRVETLRLFVPASLQEGVDESRQPKVEDLIPSGHFMVFLWFEKTEHAAQVMPYVAPETSPEKAAGWIMSMINEYPDPPDLSSKQTA